MAGKYIRKHRIRGILALALAAWLLPAGIVFPASETESVPVVRGEVVRNFARVTFEWPTEVYINASAKGNTLVLTFDRRANPDFGALLARLSPYLTHAELSADGKTVRLTLDQPYRVRSFVSGHINGVDILGIDPSMHGKTLPATQQAQAAASAARAAKKAASLAPAAGAPREAPQPKAPAAPPSPAAATASDVPASPAAPKAPPVSPAPLPPPAVFAPDTAVAPPANMQTAESVKVFAGVADGRAVLRFAWPERVAAAAFVRGGTLWIIFDRKAPLDLSAVKETATALYPSLSKLEHHNATILRLRVPPGSGIVASRDADTFEWRMMTLPTPQPPGQPLRVEVNTDPPLPAHVFLPLQESATPLVVEDPDIGDTLLVIPSHQPGQGVAQRRNFVEFALIESGQGLVVQKIADTVAVTPVRNGLRIGGKAGSPLSPDLPSPESAPHASQPSQSQDAVLFPYAQWRADPEVPLLAQINGLEEAISAARSGEQASQLRRRLAELYLAEGMAAEALGMLHEIRRTDPQFYVASRASALSGAAGFLMYRFTDAAQDFDSIELQGNRETGYWKAMLSDLLGNPDQAYDYLENHGPYISKYPPLIRQRMALMAADRAIAQSEYNMALQILDTLKEAKLLTEIEEDIAYLLGQVALETGKEEEGLNTLKTLAENYRKPSVRAKAEFALISHALKSQPEDFTPLIERFERLQASWRGDTLEMETLKILAELHAKKENYVQAMKFWRDLTTYFPGTALAAEAMSRMRATFVNLFDRGVAASLSPLDQLSLYYEYRSLTPSDAAGDRIIHGIADRLAAMDLLEQAITLLDYRMRYLYEKEARSRTGAKLARTYLLNRQPEKALQALNNSVYGNNPEDLRIERDRLAAQAMVELSRYTEALRLLEADKSMEAEAIRQRAYWRQKDWPRFIASMEEDFKRHDPGTPLSSSETDRLIQLAVAYLLQEDTAQVQYLRDYFTPLLADSPKAALFGFITAPQMKATPETFEAFMQQVDDTRKFLSSYKIRTAAAADAASAPGNP